MHFSEEYGRLRTLRAAVAETHEEIPEFLLQCLWYDQLFTDDNLATDDGRSLRVLSPGWWNRSEGPDFRGAQLDIAGKFYTGDVEIHGNHGGWRQHGHHTDSRYDDVVLEVVLESTAPVTPPTTSKGRRVPCLLLRNFLAEDVHGVLDRFPVDDHPNKPPTAFGQCAAIAEAYGTDHVVKLLLLAGEWRLLNKARTLRERMERVGADQAVYEAFMSACGYSQYKQHFRAIAQQVHYERVRQLARQDPLLLETALLQVAGLLPDALPEGSGTVHHFGRLQALRSEFLGGLRSLLLLWKRTGARPINYPERRLAGAARFIARTAAEGLAETLNRVWDADLNPVQRRKAFEALFPGPTGFWASRYSWTGRKLASPVKLIGSGRIRSIIGNVFIPAALAVARKQKDRALEERILTFFAALPKEPNNRIVLAMVPRLFGDVKPPKCDFRFQQGLIQMYQDWCEHNPSCHQCSIIPFLDVGYIPLVRAKD